MRPSHDEYFLDMLRLVAARSTCPRRSVGAIITSVDHQLLATGYNGVPRGVQHCNETLTAQQLMQMTILGAKVVDCEGKHDTPGDSSRCLAVHAEQNALLQCHRLDLAHTIYTSNVPCFTCAKLICNSSIRRVVALEEYHGQGEDLLKAVGIEVVVRS